MSATRQLIAAIDTRNNRKVAKLLEEMDVDEVNGKDNGQTALYVACQRRSNDEALDLLLSKTGIDVNVKNSSGSTPLHNYYAASKILDNPHVDVNVQKSGGWTPLHCACWNNCHKIVSALLASPGINVNVRNISGKTPIMFSAVRCHEEALRLMLEDSRVDLNCKDDDGEGLDVLVGGVEGSEELKEKCVEMIDKERVKGENRQVEQGQASPDGNVGQGQAGPDGSIEMCIEKIDKLNEDIENGEKKLKERMDIKKRKRDLDGKQTLEKQTLVKKHKEEEAVLEQKHQEEETMLEATFAKEEEVERRNIIILKELRDELVQNVQKKTTEPGKDTSSDDHDKVEAARKSLECPICMELMKPPTRIWMCRFTHMICELCKDRLNGGNCPTCTTEAVTWRAFMAENLAGTIFSN